MRGHTVQTGHLQRTARYAIAVVSAGFALTLAVPVDVALAAPPGGVCPVPGQVTENVFVRVTPASGSTVLPGDLVGADFHDETQLNTTAPDQLRLSLTGPGGTSTLTPTITTMPAYTDGTTGEFKIVKRIRATLPANPAPGSYSATIVAWDSDQTRPGADCGTATWTFTVQAPTLGNLSGDIVLCSTKVHVGGGTISATGPQTLAAAGDPVSYQKVLPGSYLVSASAPSGYHFVACNGGATIVNPHAATLTVSVPVNGSGSARFFVDPNPGAVTTTASPSPNSGVLAASTPGLPKAGREGLLNEAVVGLVLVLLGMTMLVAVARSTRSG